MSESEKNYEIKPATRLTHWRDDYADAEVFEYQDAHNHFYFDVNYANSKKINGIDVYDAKISMLGKKKPRYRERIPVQDLEQVKDNIQDYFASHPISVIADPPPQHVIFE